MGMRSKMGSMFLSNEELGKKDDDHKPTGFAPMRAQWSAATRTSPRKTLKRLAIAFALGVFVYLFIKNLPTDVPIRDRRHPVYRPAPVPDGPPTPAPMPNPKPVRKPERPSPPPPAPTPQPAAPAARYNGHVVLTKLTSSLYAVSGTTMGFSTSNRNVLFAAASLRSAALLLPMACQMAAELRSYVHFALMGGSEIEMEQLRLVNGIDDSCQVVFHGTYSEAPAMTFTPGGRWKPGADLISDARPDSAVDSTTNRLRRSVDRGLCKSRAQESASRILTTL